MFCFVVLLPHLSCKHPDVLSKVDNVKKLDPSNAALMATLHSAFSHNMEAINFWLRYCVFAGNTQQYPQRLMTSAWHLTATPGAAAGAAAGTTRGLKTEGGVSGAQPPTSFVVGFSGTKDNHRLLPATVHQKQLPDPQLAGTDGRMLAALLNPAVASGYVTLPVQGEGKVRNDVLQLAWCCKHCAALQVSWAADAAVGSFQRWLRDIQCLQLIFCSTFLTTLLCGVALQAGWQVVLDQALEAGCSALLDCGALLAEADAG
jgi:hypothetical protein